MRLLRTYSILVLVFAFSLAGCEGEVAPTSAAKDSLIDSKAPGCDSNGQSASHNPHCATPLPTPTPYPYSAQLKLQFGGPAPSGRFAAGVANAGDFDGDGNTDIVVGDNHYGGNIYNVGRVTVFSSRDGSAIFTRDSNDEGGRGLGWSVSSAGDINGDRKSEIIVGYAWNRVSLFSSSSVASIRNHTGEQSAGCFGYAVSSVGDVNGDGRSDYMVGDPCYSTSGTSTNNYAGKVYIFSGSNGSLIQSIVGAPGDNLGFTLNRVGDLNGDGVADFVIGARFAGVFAYSGADRSLLWAVHNADYAHSVASAGDFNNDGFADVAVGTRGGVGVVLSGVNGSKLFTTSSTNSETHAMTVGDLDGDGYDDLAVTDNRGVSIYSARTGKTVAHFLTDTYADGLALVESPTTPGSFYLVVGSTSYASHVTTGGLVDQLGGAFVFSFQ